MAFQQRNGCNKFECKESDGLARPFRSRPQNVAAIDFGTINCSLMYLLAVDTVEEPTKVQPTRLKFNGYHRVPNCALFNEQGRMIALGERAQRQYYHRTKRANTVFFRKIKMHLQRDSTVSRNITVKAVNGEEFYLVDVIAHILNWMKERLVEHVALHERKATDFDWVITVPAMWQSRGKQMMREAGYKAGLCTDNEPKPLRPAWSSKPQMFVDPNPDRLSLALEPECAILHCRQVRKFEEKNYILVDIGGGTVDIVSHRIVNGHLEETNSPKGNEWGGSTVNTTFQNFLGETLRDPKFSRYIDQQDNEKIRVDNKEELEYLVDLEFEGIKKDFGEDYKSHDDYTARLPMLLVDEYKETIKATKTEGFLFNLKANILKISKQKMAELFEPTIEGIISIVKEVLQDGGGIIKDVFLAGGFGGCQYVKMKLQSALEEMQQGIKVHPAPPESELGIVHGAVMFRCDPSIVHKRKADATYGVHCLIPFQSDIHCESKRKKYKNKEKDYCDDIFCTIVERGESIVSRSVFVSDFTTMTENQTKTTFDVYVSPKTNVWYVTDPGVQKLGRFKLDLAGIGDNQSMEVAVDFTHTELQFRCYDKQNPAYETKSVVDFLDPK